MVSSLICLAALGLAPAQEGELKIVNERTTYGHLGAPRPRVKTGVVPGDVLHILFELEGMKLDQHGQGEYSMLMTIKDAAGKTVFQIGPKGGKVQNSLGGNRVPCMAVLDVPLGTEPGPMSWNVEVTDLGSKKKAKLSGVGKVAAPDFALVRISTSTDPSGQVPQPPVGVVGGTVYVHFSAVGFARDEKTKNPDVRFSLKVRDSDGKQTLSEPLTGEVKEWPEDNPFIGPGRFGLTMNREGDFTLELTAEDRVAGKQSRIELPLRVIRLEVPKAE